MSRLIKGLMLAGLMLASASQAQTVEYIHTDALGSVVAVTNGQRKVVERREYEPYGHQLTPAVANGPGYTGHVQDAVTGLVYMQQRYYDGQIGRFLSVDPVTAYANPIIGFNRYRYAVNNPYRFTDPDGRVDWDKLGDSFNLELGFGLALDAKIKIGPLKASLGVGSAYYGGGATFAPDLYGFTEVSEYSATLEFGDYGVGVEGASERSYMGRNGQRYSEEESRGGAFFGRKRGQFSVEKGGRNGELSGSVGLIFLKATGSIDLGQAWEALKSQGAESGDGGTKNGSSPGGGFQGVFDVDGRLASKRLENRLK